MAPKPKSPHLYLVEDRGYRTPCWVWQRAANSAGYGVMRTGEGSKTVALAHRVFWERENGPIPEGLTLDHLCRVELCVRPSHCEPVTHTVNMRRGAQTKLTVAKAKRIRVRLAAGEGPSSIARAFDISESNVRRIRAGRLWAAV